MKKIIIFVLALFFVNVISAVCTTKVLAPYGDYVPGLRTWQENYIVPNIGISGSTINFASKESAIGGSSMVVYTAGGNPNPGFLETYEIAANTSGYDGISFWVKGDGSNGTGTLVINLINSFTYSGFNFSLNDTSWKKYYVYWNNFSIYPSCTCWFVFYTINNNNQPAHYFIDDVKNFKGDCPVETITPQSGSDPGPVNVLQFSHNRSKISNTLTKMQNRQSAKIIVMGDSVVEGAQLWYTRNDVNYMFVNVLNNSLKSFYGYNGVVVEKHSLSGSQTSWGLTEVSNVIAKNPDAVVWEFGGNDCTYGNLANYEANTRAAVQQLKAAGIEVVIDSPAPWWESSYCNQVEYEQFRAKAEQIANDYNMTFVDIGKMLLSRGYIYGGDLLSDQVHLNHRGHAFYAKTLYSAFTGQEQTIWDDLPTFLYQQGSSTDVNFDGFVNVKDLAIIIFNQGRAPTGNYAHLDLNSDSSINWNDVQIVMSSI